MKHSDSRNQAIFYDDWFKTIRKISLDANQVISEIMVRFDDMFPENPGNTGRLQINVGLRDLHGGFIDQAIFAFDEAGQIVCFASNATFSYKLPFSEQPPVSELRAALAAFVKAARPQNI